MILLTTINDVRKYRQLGKQLNSDNFEGRVREVQENELTELLGKALAYDFFNELETGWIDQVGTFTRNSDTQFTIVGVDLTAILLANYSLKINSNVFVSIVSSVLIGSDTVIVVKGYTLPDTLSTIEYKAENKYILLLNGNTYTEDSKTIQFNGLRPFIAWKLLAIFLTDGNVKHSDTGNFSITSPNFERPSAVEIREAKSTYLQNSVREENNIIDYLNSKYIDFPLWEQKTDENINNFDFIVI